MLTSLLPKVPVSLSMYACLCLGFGGCDGGGASSADVKAVEAVAVAEAPPAKAAQVPAEPPTPAPGEDAETGPEEDAVPDVAVAKPDVALSKDDEQPAKAPSESRRPEPKPKTPPKVVEEKTDSVASAEPAGAPNGKDIYTKKCKNCHGSDGKADTKLGIKHEIDSWAEAGWKGKWTLAKVEEIVREGKEGTKMKPFKDKLSGEEITAVAKYARSLGRS